MTRSGSRPRRWRWSTRSYLAFFAAALTLPILAFAAFLLWQYATGERARLEHAALEEARDVTQAVDGELGDLVASAQILALTPAVRNSRLEEYHRLALDLHRLLGMIAVLRAPDGQQVVSPLAPFGTPLPRTPLPSDQTVLSTKRPQVSDLFIGSLSRAPLFSVTVPALRDDGQVHYLLDLSFPVERLKNLIAREQTPENWVVALVDRNGTIMARSHRHDEFVGKPATRDLQENTTGLEGTWEGFTADGRAVLGAYARSKLADWRVAVGVQRAELAAPLQRSLQWFAALGAGLLAVAALLASLFGQRITAPVEALAGRAAALGRGEAVAPVETRVSEIGRVGEALATASTELRQREAALRESERQLRDESRMLETLNRTGAAVGSELDLGRVVQMVTDAGVEVTGAKFGAFFYNVLNEAGESYMLYTLSGVDRSEFERFPQPRATAVFEPTFKGEGVIRSDDILADPRYGQNAPNRGMPEGHLPVRSYLAVPVTSRSGEVLGGLFFGHPEPGRFTQRHEQLMIGIAAWAAIALDNARLFQAAQREIAQRRQAEERLRDLNATLEQRVAEAIAERENAEAQLRQAHKMEAVGRLTGGVAHDFNNLLTVVTGNLDMLRRRIDAYGDLRLVRNVENAIEGANRAAQLTHRLLAFSRQSPLQPEIVDANKIVAGMSDLLRRTLGETISIETVLAGGLWRTEVDPNQLENALLNLAVNARDAMPDGGKLTIETANTYLDEAYAAGTNGEVKAGQYVLVSISDSGTGMTPEVQTKVFEPFFTTKPVGKGTGLGLAQVYGFMRQSGGHAAIYSEPGQGTTVKLYFPRVAGARERQHRSADAPIAPRPVGGETILVVEDEPMVRDFSTSALEEAGYRVLAAEDGPSALALLDRQPEIALLFTDVVLSGPMNGRKVADEALRRRPHLKVLFTTGYTRNAIIHHGRLDEDVELLSKPFTAEALVRRVYDLIRSDRPRAPLSP
ncbi:MAG TPA: ATP-binding protein [Microvirga sp.]|nr:ATP-binding protein [Microvirga sp.]